MPVSDCNSTNNAFNEGVHTFEVASYPVQVPAGNFLKTSWEFKVDGSNKTFKLSFFDNQMVDLLRALGCNEIKPLVFDWKEEEVFGKKFSAELYYETDKQGKMNDRTGEVFKYKKLKDFKPVEQGVIGISPSEIAWEDS